MTMSPAAPTPPEGGASPATSSGSTPPRNLSPVPAVRRVGLGAPLRWLRAGAGDLTRAPGPSLFYGCAFALAGWSIYAVFQFAYALAYGLTWGFLLVGPYLAAGLYDISRRLQAGERVSLAPTLLAWRANLGGFSVFSIVLTVLMLLWSRASLIVFALYFSTNLPSVKDLLLQTLSLEHWEFLLAYFALGAVFAQAAFSISVVSIPMMMDRKTDAIVAAITSTRAMFENPLPLLVWALLIVGLTAVGFATGFLGLIVTTPILGHATWHAYRELVAPDPPAA
jgi:uncharacterized membrane protein